MVEMVRNESGDRKSNRLYLLFRYVSIEDWIKSVRNPFESSILSSCMSLCGRIEEGRKQGGNMVFK